MPKVKTYAYVRKVTSTSRGKANCTVSGCDGPMSGFSDHLSVPQKLRRYKFGVANKCSQNWKTTQVMNDHMKYLLHI